MKPIVAVAALAALLAADIAGSAAAAAPRLSVHHARALRPHRPGRIGRRHRMRLRPTALVARAPGANAPARVYTADDGGPPGSPGFFKSEKDRQAGWGFEHGGVQTVVGLYQRPAQAGDVPGPQIYHTPESRGAAGLSLSFKLGH